DELDVLLDPVDLGLHDRRVPGLRVVRPAALLLLLALRRRLAGDALDRRLPGDLAGRLLEGDEGRVRPAGGADDEVAVDQRRLGVGPPARVATELLLVALLPLQGAGADLDADEVAVRTDGVGVAVVDRRGRLRGRVPADLIPDLHV